MSSDRSYVTVLERFFDVIMSFIMNQAGGHSSHWVLTITMSMATLLTAGTFHWRVPGEAEFKSYSICQLNKSFKAPI